MRLYLYEKLKCQSRIEEIVSLPDSVNPQEIKDIISSLNRIIKDHESRAAITAPQPVNNTKGNHL